MKALRKIYVDEGFNAGTDGGYTDEIQGTNDSAYINQQDLVEWLEQRLALHKKHLHQFVREVEGTKDSAKEDEVWEIINHIKGE